MKIVLLPCYFWTPSSFRWGSGDLCLGKPKRFREIQRDSWYKTNSEIFQLLGTVKTCMRKSWISRKIFRELLRLRNSWKISSQIISWFQKIQMEIIMVKTIQEFCLVFSLIKEQTYRFFVMVEAHSDEEIHTPAILEDFLPDHDRTMTESRPKTHLTDPLSSMSHFLFPFKGSG